MCIQTCQVNNLGAHERMGNNNAVENAIKSACLEMSLELTCRNTRERVLKRYLDKILSLLTCPMAMNHLLTHVHSATTMSGSVEVIDFRTVTLSRYTQIALLGTRCRREIATAMDR